MRLRLWKLLPYRLRLWITVRRMPICRCGNEVFAPWHHAPDCPVHIEYATSASAPKGPS